MYMFSADEFFLLLLSFVIADRKVHLSRFLKAEINIT